VVDPGAWKTGTGGGRGGVAGGAFSLSVLDSWLAMAVFGGGWAVASVLGAVLKSAGGLGNSLTICTCQTGVVAGLRSVSITSSRRSKMYCSVSGHSALQLSVSSELQRRCSYTYESSEPCSAAFCRMVSARWRYGQHVTGLRRNARLRRGIGTRGHVCRRGCWSAQRRDAAVMTMIKGND
jgi:hypothetical protein